MNTETTMPALLTVPAPLAAERRPRRSPVRYLLLFVLALLAVAGLVALL